MYWYSKKLNKKFYYKVPALLLEQEPLFCMDEVYNQYDWSKEPSESWQTLIRERLEELRETHKFVRFWYSGGSDSQTILLAILKHKIHVDEIAILRQSLVNEFDGPECYEINRVALPQIKAIKSDLKCDNIKIYDIGYEQYKKYYETFDINHTNALDFRAVYTNNIDKFIPRINDYESIINIDGLEKPQINIDENYKFYWSYYDATLMNNIAAPEFKQYVDHFFMYPKLHVKQCYMVMNAFFEKNIDMKNLDDVAAVCRDDLYFNFSYGKATRNTLPPKMLISIEKAASHSEAKHVLERYLYAMNNSGLDKSFFINENPLLGFDSITTKPYYLD